MSSASGLRKIHAAIRHELYFLNYFRLAQALVYIALAFSPLGMQWLRLARPETAHWTAIGYLVFALVMLLLTRRLMPSVLSTTSFSLLADIAAAVVLVVSIHDARIGIAMMLVVNLSVGALILPLRLSLFLAALATFGMLGHSLLESPAVNLADNRELLEAGLFGLAYFASASLCHALGRQLRATEALAEQRSTDLVNLSQVNELIIRRMKTGVLLVDDANLIHQINESAWMLLGNPSADQRDLGQLAPELSRRLY